MVSSQLIRSKSLTWHTAGQIRHGFFNGVTDSTGSRWSYAASCAGRILWSTAGKKSPSQIRAKYGSADRRPTSCPPVRSAHPETLLCQPSTAACDKAHKMPRAMYIGTPTLRSYRAVIEDLPDLLTIPKSTVPFRQAQNKCRRKPGHRGVRWPRNVTSFRNPKTAGGCALDVAPVVEKTHAKTMLQPLGRSMTGTIRTLRTDKGFGFIKDAGGKGLFFHQSAVQGEGINDLREGDSVEFEVGMAARGRGRRGWLTSA